MLYPDSSTCLPVPSASLQSGLCLHEPLSRKSEDTLVVGVIFRFGLGVRSQAVMTDKEPSLC